MGNTKSRFRPLGGMLEKQFQGEAFEILKRAMLDSQILIVPAKTEEMREAMSKIGMLYHSMVPEEF